MPQKKTFGLFEAPPAKVRAYIEEPDPVEERDPAQEAAGYLKSVLKEMGLPEAGVEIRREEAGAALTLSGEDIGFIIGHRGETLDALQYLASLVANHADGSYFRITPGRGQLPGEAEGNPGGPGKEDGGPGGKDRPELLFGAHEPLRAAHYPHRGADRARRQVLERRRGPGPARGHWAGRGERPQRRNDRRGGGRNDRGRSGRGGYNDRNRRPRSDRSRPNPAPRAEGPRRMTPTPPIYGRIEKK